MAGKTDIVVGSCSVDDCGGRAVGGVGWCDELCAVIGDCADGIAQSCGLDQCRDDAGCFGGGKCATGEPNRCEVEAPAFCANGTVVHEAAYVPSADDKECAMPKVHCVTNDHGACPQFTPLPPDFCEDGTVVSGPPSFTSSADDMECSLPSVHCLTNDFEIGRASCRERV